MTALYRFGMLQSSFRNDFPIAIRDTRPLSTGYGTRRNHRSSRSYRREYARKPSSSRWSPKQDSYLLHAKISLSLSACSLYGEIEFQIFVMLRCLNRNIILKDRLWGIHNEFLSNNEKFEQVPCLIQFQSFDIFENIAKTKSLKLSTAVKLFHKVHLRFLDPVHKKLYNIRYWPIKSYKTPHFYFHINPIKLTIHRTSSKKPLLPKTQSCHYKNEPIPTPWHFSTGERKEKCHPLSRSVAVKFRRAFARILCLLEDHDSFSGVNISFRER